MPAGIEPLVGACTSIMLFAVILAIFSDNRVKSGENYLYSKRGRRKGICPWCPCCSHKIKHNKSLKKIMYKKVLMTMMLGVALLPVSLAEPQEFIESVFEEDDVKYTLNNDKVQSQWSDERVLECWVDSEQSLLSVRGVSFTRLPQAKRLLAYEKLNELNSQKADKFYLDDDGNVYVEIYVDIDDMVLSKKAFRAAVARVLNSLKLAREEMMKIRYAP